MNKPRKYNGVYKLPIKKHTKVRRPMSRWQLEYMLFENNPVLISNTLKMSVPPIKVNDISIGLENPLWSTRLFNCTCSPPILGKYHYPSCFSHTNGIDWSKDMADTIKDLFDDLKSPSYFVVNKEQAKKIEEYNKAISKPSLLTRVKNRFKR